jgi:hypothetical protein
MAAEGIEGAGADSHVAGGDGACGGGKDPAKKAFSAKQMPSKHAASATFAISTQQDGVMPPCMRRLSLGNLT